MRAPEHQRKSYVWRWTAALGGLAVLALALVVGLLRPGMPQESSEAAMVSPGGIAAMPAALPGMPGCTGD